MSGFEEVDIVTTDRFSDFLLLHIWVGGLVVKNPPTRDAGSIPGEEMQVPSLGKRCRFHRWGRSLGGGHGNPLQYSCLENPRDRGIIKSQTLPK